MFRMRLNDILIFLFVENSLLIDVSKVSDRIQVLLFCCFLVVINPSSYFGLSVGVKTIELLLEVQQAFLEKLANAVEAFRISLLC